MVSHFEGDDFSTILSINTSLMAALPLVVPCPSHRQYTDPSDQDWHISNKNYTPETKDDSVGKSPF